MAQHRLGYRPAGYPIIEMAHSGKLERVGVWDDKRCADNYHAKMCTANYPRLV